MGLGYANWEPPTRIGWGFALGDGLVAGIVIFGIGSASGQNMMLGRDWRLALLQVTLGPVLEEVVFRGYLYSLLTWVIGKTAGGLPLNWLVIATAAVVFTLVHLAQPGVRLAATALHHVNGRPVRLDQMLVGFYGAGRGLARGV